MKDNGDVSLEHPKRGSRLGVEAEGGREIEHPDPKPIRAIMAGEHGEVAKRERLLIAEEEVNAALAASSAYAANFMSVEPSYRIVVCSDLLNKLEGRTVKQLLQEHHGGRIALPKQRSAHPERALLAERHGAFLKAS